MTLVAPKTIVITAGTPNFANGIVNSMDEIMESAGPKKRKRLTHLTPEERMLRRSV